MASCFDVWYLHAIGNYEFEFLVYAGMPYEFWVLNTALIIELH